MADPMTNESAWERVLSRRRFLRPSIWLSQQQIADLFQTSRTNVVEHVQHAYAEGELTEAATCRKIRQIRTEGTRQGGGTLAGVVDAIYQGFGGHDLYPSVEEKAANLLYLVVKDHPLSDGIKRSAA